LSEARTSELGPGEEPELDRFLLTHADSSMFLRANLRSAGLVDHGRRLDATYVAARVDGAMVAVAAHCWNGVVLVQGRLDEIAAVVRAAVERTGREVAGFSGPFAQVAQARDAMGLRDRPATLDAREDLFALELDRLRVPPLLVDGTWQCRRPAAEELPRIVRWRIAYAVETLGEVETPALHERTREQLESTQSQWVLAVGDDLVATSAFNAELPDTVQVGGVYTPPELRGRGYGRAVVAGSLLDARARGVERSILFTPVDHGAAHAAYAALGYRVVGDYGIVLFTR
jgi:GNAT superfamily N-acetyltransferase